MVLAEERSEAGAMTPVLASYHRHRFAAEIMGHAVGLYHVFSLSLRDLELILVERGIAVTHESICRWYRSLAKPPRPSCVGAGRSRVTSGPSRKSPPASTASRTTFGARSISTGRCWTSWCRTGEMARRQSASPSGCCEGCGSSRGASSPTARGATASRGATGDVPFDVEEGEAALPALSR